MDRNFLTIWGLRFHSNRSSSTMSEFCAPLPNAMLTFRLHFGNLGELSMLAAQNGANRNTENAHENSGRRR